MGSAASSIQPSLKEEKKLSEKEIHPKLLELLNFDNNCDQDKFITLEKIIELLSSKKDIFISFDLDNIESNKRISKINDLLLKKG